MGTADASLRTPDPLSRATRFAIAVVIVLAVFGFALPQFASASAVWHVLGHVGWRGATWLALAAGWNLVTYCLVWMAAVPNLGLRRAALLATAPTAVANTVPAGSYVSVALSYSMLRSWGRRPSAATLALVVTGIWNNFAKLGLPSVSVAALAMSGDIDATRITTAALGLSGLIAAIAVFVAAMRTDAAAVRVARAAAAIATPLLRFARRPPPAGWDVALREFRSSAGDLLAARWHLLTAATAVGHVSLFLVLLASLRAAGVAAGDISLTESLAVFAFARLATAVPFTPGGLGVVELAMTAGLVAAGGPRAPVVAAVLVYRGLTYLLQIPLGATAYLHWRRTVHGLGGRPLSVDGSDDPAAGPVNRFDSA